jgi:hypothetical protein
MMLNNFSVRSFYLLGALVAILCSTAKAVGLVREIESLKVTNSLADQDVDVTVNYRYLGPATFDPVEYPDVQQFVKTIDAGGASKVFDEVPNYIIDSLYIQSPDRQTTIRGGPIAVVEYQELYSNIDTLVQELDVEIKPVDTSLRGKGISVTTFCQLCRQQTNVVKKDFFTA